MRPLASTNSPASTCAHSGRGGHAVPLASAQCGHVIHEHANMRSRTPVFHKPSTHTHTHTHTHSKNIATSGLSQTSLSMCGETKNTAHAPCAPCANSPPANATHVSTERRASRRVGGSGVHGGGGRAHLHDTLHALVLEHVNARGHGLERGHAAHGHPGHGHSALRSRVRAARGLTTRQKIRAHLTGIP